MRFTTLSSAALALSQVAMAASEVHGQSELGNTMGPVDFLWPSSREWSANADNTAPCGSTEGVTDRTVFPLKQGSVSLSIADDAYNVAFYIAVDDDPDAASDFKAQVVQTISEVEPGHQCYKLAGVPSVESGTNATIQLQYWANYEDDDSANEKFYACADVTFVEAADFDIQTPCFNVTSEEFELPSSDTSSKSDKSDDNNSSSGLSKGAIAGIAVGVAVGSLSVVGLVAWFMFKRRKESQRDAEADYPVKQVEEISSQVSR